MKVSEHAIVVKFKLKQFSSRVKFLPATVRIARPRGPFRVMVQSNGSDFEIVGEASEYVKTSAESGNPRIQGFCGTCGSSLYACDLERSLINIRAACLEDSSTFSPKIHMFGSSSPSWLDKMNESDWLEKGLGSQKMLRE